MSRLRSANDPRTAAQAPGQRRIVQQPGHVRHQGGGIETGGEQPVLAVGDELAHRVGVAADHGTAAGQRLPQAPGQHEGVGEVDVGVRALQQTDEQVVGDAPGEVHASRVVAVAELAQQVRTPGRTDQACPVADAVRTDHHHLQVRPQRLQAGQRAHDGVEAPIRFEVAGDVGHQRVRGLNAEALDVQHGPARPGVGLTQGQVHALGQHGNAVLRPVRVGRELEACRRLAVTGVVEGEQVDRVLRPDRGMAGDGLRHLGIEADIQTALPVVELEIAEHRHVPHVADVQQLAPAVVADDDVRVEAEPAQPGREVLHHPGAQECDLEVPHVREGALVRLRRLVGELAHPRDMVLVGPADEDDVVAGLGYEAPDQVEELAREVLMDKEVAHGGRERAGPAFSAARTASSPPCSGRGALGRTGAARFRGRFRRRLGRWCRGRLGRCRLGPGGLGRRLGRV